MTVKVNLELLKRNRSKMDKLFMAILDLFVKKTGNKLYVHSKDSRFYLVSMYPENPILLRIPFTLIELQLFNVGGILR